MTYLLDVYGDLCVHFDNKLHANFMIYYCERNCELSPYNMYMLCSLLEKRSAVFFVSLKSNGHVFTVSRLH
jgi:hypothetical protein